MVTRYWLLSEPLPCGCSKFGGLANLSAPSSIMKSLLSAPAVDHSMVPPSGSVALKVYIVAVTFSLTVKSVLLVVVMTGGSFTSVTVMVTGR